MKFVRILGLALFLFGGCATLAPNEPFRAAMAAYFFFMYTIVFLQMVKKKDLEPV